jgi:hypothetical protein
MQAAGLYLLKAGAGSAAGAGGHQQHCQQAQEQAAGGAPPTACVADPAVYTRSRHFRMIWSCKGGKGAVLRPTARYMQARLPAGAPLANADTFMVSLICNVHPAARLLEVPLAVMQQLVRARPPRAMWTRHARQSVCQRPQWAPSQLVLPGCALQLMLVRPHAPPFAM